MRRVALDRAVVVVALLALALLLPACVRGGFFAAGSDTGIDTSTGTDTGGGGGDTAAANDLVPPGELCPLAPDADTVALFLFGGSGSGLTNEVTGSPAGQLVGTRATRVAGPGRCGGSALQIPAGPTTSCSGCTSGTVRCAQDPAYGRLPGTIGQQLTSGSVDLWVRFDGPPHGTRRQGILSRDAIGTVEPGHLSLWRLSDRSVGARLQGPGGNNGVICSDPLPDGGWHHVLVNFGPPGLQLQVDGKWVGSAKTAGITICSSSDQATAGVDGNNEPWVIGSSTEFSCVDSPLPATGPLPGTIASLRISRVRRDFSGDFPP